MDLKEFTKQALVQIVKGIEEANLELESNGCEIVTKGIRYAAGQDFKYVYENGAHIIDVDFDVAITATESEGSNGGAGLKVVSLFNMGGYTENKIENQTISRIKYTLPLTLEKAINHG